MKPSIDPPVFKFNPALQEYPLYLKAIPIPPTGVIGMLEWLEEQGRLIARESHEINLLESEDPEISQLMEDGTFVVEEEESNDNFEGED
jgi:hypothetical protein